MRLKDPLPDHVPCHSHTEYQGWQCPFCMIANLHAVKGSPNTKFIANCWEED